MPPLRLAAVITQEAANATSGARFAFERLCTALRRRGHGVTVHSASELPPSGPGGASGAAARLRQACAVFTEVLVRAWTTQRPDLVHIELAGNVGLAALDAAARLGLPAISSFHHLHLYAPPGQEHRVVGLLAAFHRRCVLTVAESEASCRLLGVLGAGTSMAIGRGIDAEAFHPRFRDPELRRAWGAGADDPVLLWVGRMVGTKDLPGLAAACQAARQRVPALRVVLVGDGPEAGPLRAALPWAVCSGELRGEVLARAYASADLFAFSSPAEPYGNVVLEAAASGLAIAARAGGAVDDMLVPAGACVMPPPRDRAAFAEAVAGLAADPERRIELGHRARQAVEGRSWEVVAARWEDAMRVAIAGG